MSELARKINELLENNMHESFAPKSKPEILSILEETKNQFRSISEINAFQENLEIFSFPASRVIGVEESYKLGGDEQNTASPQWQRVCTSEIWDKLNALPQIVKDTCFGWTCDYIAESDTFSYIVSVLATKDSPVPAGCTYRDLPETLVAVGRWGEPMNEAIEKMQEIGFSTNYDLDGCGWNAELYLLAEESLPAPNGQPWRWMIPCKRDENYFPKNKPEIIEMANNSKEVNEQAEMTVAPSTIPIDKRNSVRIVELPACKMVTSGPMNGGDAFAPSGPFDRFAKWFCKYDDKRSDKFYPRDFMWSPIEGGFQWGYAVDKIPEDIEGLEITDFPGGLYAVAISVDADGADHDAVYNGILEWVGNSGCFMLDENEKRRSLGHITSPPFANEAMGYAQMDLYYPIAIKKI